MYSLQTIPSDTKIRKFIRSIVFGKNIHCPECKSRMVVSSGKRYRCRLCRCKFSLFSHTWMSNIKIPLRAFWLIVWCYTAGIPIKQASSISEISCKGARFWYDTFRKSLPNNKVILERIVQLDEAYFGGFRGKALLMAKEKGTRKLAFEVLDHEPTKYDAVMFLRNHVKHGVVLCTDGSPIYKGIEKYFPLKHIVNIHKAWEYSQTSEIEGVFGNLRTFIRRMYHHVTTEKLEEIVREFSFRFSHPEIFKNPRIFLRITLCLVTTGC